VFELQMVQLSHLSYPVLSCLVLSCLVLSCLVLSCLVLSCLVLSCLVLSCLVLSCLASLTHSLNHPPTHSLTHTPTPTHLLTHLLTFSPTHTLIHLHSHPLPPPHMHYSSHRSTNLDKEEYYDESEESAESALSGTDYLLYSYGFVSEKEPEKYDISLPKPLISEILRADLMNTDSRLEFF
jgi:hypothetical protein